jgi:RimJ/RimL family protein N-acetyltransferase
MSVFDGFKSIFPPLPPVVCSHNKLPMLPTLHCKPYNHEILFTKSTSLGVLTLRSLVLKTDLDIIFNWVNQDYAKKFWQMDGARDFLHNSYHMILESPHAHSFIILLDNQPVGQIDLYMLLSDELKNHVKAEPEDCGLHLLMCPPRQSARGLSVAVLKFFIDYYFSFSLSQELYAEPDKNNLLANLLARKAGFQFICEIDMTAKKANLYCITRNNL